MNAPENESLDFVRQIVADDQSNGKHAGRVHTRFPPEPNGYLHIGHAKSICLNFGIAEQYGGKCNLRFDDTNPEKEDTEYVEAIKEDIRWLGFDWQDRLFFASDYFDQLYQWAIQLIRGGHAYVCDQTAEEVREYRGGWNKEGRNSPYRERSVEENLDLFERMKQGEFADGEKTLRAKIDMTSANMNLRDPAMYRIRHVHHHRTGDAWCIYPTYDWAHGQSDSMEGITHSICTLEFENHRPLYDWYLDHLGAHHPQQIEFAKLVLSYTVTSKRKLLELVQGDYVDGWDDPRMPTLSGFRRRGFTPESIRQFCNKIGVTKFNSLTDLSLLEQSIREHLNKIAPRVMGVLDPLKVVIENYPEGESEMRNAINNPEDDAAGIRTIPFGRELYIERSDFLEDAPRKFFRLTVGREVRLRYAYFLKCESVVKNDAGEIVELRCTYDPETAGGKAPDGRKVKGTIHWVSAEHAVDAEVRLYEHLFTQENPSDVPEGVDWKELLNPDSLKVLTHCKLEPSLAEAQSGDRFQFERNGYFCVDAQDSTADKLVFNRTVSLKDGWSKAKKKNG
ncbi:MAG: glutamine--tRNA ligase/YqeY domain fusion protein [Mariniblastus sp.]|nr:glutamine--tRNA ligase/YqeY domain fusion protein [Mariniblastus sp.]